MKSPKNPNRPRGGRPPKPETERLKRRLVVCLTETDYDALCRKARGAGLVCAEYARRALARSIVRARMTPEMLTLLRQITGGAYQSMDVGRSLEICLNTKDRLIPLESVSSGTMDQIYLAVRLAAVRLIQGGGETLPLLFDDSFALYDDGRLAHALEFLAGHYGGQILLFTCHHREERLLSKNRTPYKMIYLKKEPQDLGGRKKLEENI